MLIQRKCLQLYYIPQEITIFAKEKIFKFSVTFSKLIRHYHIEPCEN